jgi:hypothetical protein
MANDAADSVRGALAFIQHEVAGGIVMMLSTPSRA